MVGDTDNDAQGAQALGVDFLAVSFGFGYGKGEMPDSYPCIGTADSPQEIIQRIDEVC